MPFAILSAKWRGQYYRAVNTQQHFRVALLIRFLTDEPMTAQELAEKTGINSKAVGSYLREFKRFKLIRVCFWDTDATGRSYVVPTFEWVTTNERDEPRPKISHKERSRRYRAKKKRRAELSPLLQLGKTAE